jgi:hypothetical protein
MPTSERKNANPSAAAGVAATERVIEGMRVAGGPGGATRPIIWKTAPGGGGISRSYWA